MFPDGPIVVYYRIVHAPRSDRSINRYKILWNGWNASNTPCLVEASVERETKRDRDAICKFPSFVVTEKSAR